MPQHQHVLLTGSGGDQRLEGGLQPRPATLALGYQAPAVYAAPAAIHNRLSLTAAPMSRASGGGGCILRAPGGPVDLDRDPLRGDSRVDHAKRYVRPGGGE